MVYNRALIQNPRDTLDFINTLVYGRDDFSPEMKEILLEMDKLPIQKMTIVRQPLGWVLNLAMNVLTFGQIAKNAREAGYDKFFHLAVHLTTSKGVYLLEKNQAITMAKNPKIQPNSETMNVPLIYPIDTSTLLNNTSEYMGTDFLIYDPKTANCQDFIRSVLKSNSLDTDDNIKFVLQDTDAIFKNLSNSAKFGRFLTDIATKLDIARQGGAISRKNGLTDGELVRLLRADHKFVGKIYMKDELPDTLEKNKWYIINLQNSDEGSGTHWVCFKTPALKEPMIYFDPLIGGDPPIEVLEHAKKSGVQFHMMEIQNENSTACGWFCVACILSDKGAGSSLVHFKRFISHFSFDTDRNDLILHNLLVRLRVI
jgi:hypothetical protein